MDEKARRNLGAHYTSEKNILKLIKPLFLDDLWDEYEKIKTDKGKLKKLHEKISKLRFLDPACGCGNFLVIAYRELRLLELEIVTTILKGQQITSVNDYFLLDVDRFYGIEYEEFPSQIAQVAMWLMDHQMNEQASFKFGEYYKRIPLKKSANIIQANALRIDWQSLIIPMPWEKEDPRFHYILGNPPFLGKQYQNEEQKLDMAFIFQGVKGSGVLDYVTAWYLKASQYLNQYNEKFDKYLPKTKVAFVSTNSISQGEQVGILWNVLYSKYFIKIHFAHRTFKWENEAKGNAAVHCIIIGFSNFDISEKSIYDYDNLSGEAHAIKVKNINPYLVEGKDIFIAKRRKPICQVPEMAFGNMPNDGGFFLFTDDEKKEFIKKEPESELYFKKFIGSQEFINNISRWCLWLKDVDPNILKKLPEVSKRVDLVKKTRLNSNRATTKKMAEFPTLFGEIRQPNANYLVFPEVSSERRKYIPIGFVNKDVISSNKNYTIVNATLYEFGVLSSIMHMVWVKNIGGRLKSDYQYSTGIVYNNFPWPNNPSLKQIDSIENAAKHVLDVRNKFYTCSLADLYDPNSMPPELVKAHIILDKQVDLCYRSNAFQNELKRIEYLFELYENYTMGLFGKQK